MIKIICNRHEKEMETTAARRDGNTKDLIISVGVCSSCHKEHVRSGKQTALRRIGQLFQNAVFPPKDEE